MESFSLCDWRFYDVIVKTCCILHNFVCQRDGFQFQNTLYECPLESTKAVVGRGKVTGTDMGRRAQGTGVSLHWGTGRWLVYRELMCRWRLWRRSPLPIGAPLGRMGGGSIHRELWEIVEGGLWKRSIPLHGRSVRGTWKGAPLLRTLRVM